MYVYQRYHVQAWQTKLYGSSQKIFAEAEIALINVNDEINGQTG